MPDKKSLIQPSFSNKVIDKSELKKLIVWAFRNYGIARAANMADKLKDLGFYYATKAGISLSLEDLRIPPAKKDLLNITMDSINLTDQRYYRGEITAVERFQKVIDTWNNASESLKKEVISYFKETDPLNSIYMMAFSGARGNISQVRQLVGMRGLMSDPQGQIIDLPISSNFREGLTVTDYFISSYGARKGLVDTALRTADSGYLTRRLVDVSQDVIIREVDCQTKRGILLEDMVENQRSLISLDQALLGRILADDVYDPLSQLTIAKASQEIDPSLAQRIVASKITKVLVRSPITCNSIGSVCQLCYGWNLAHGKLVDIGEAVGIIAAQSIGEPGTQLTMRTFHTGGVFTGELAQSIYSPGKGRLEYPSENNVSPMRTRHGEEAYLIDQNCRVKLVNNGSFEYITFDKGTILLKKNNDQVLEGEIIAEYPLSNRLITERAQKSILADFSGKVQFTKLTVEEIQNKQHTVRIAQEGGLVWVLSGKTYRIPDDAELTVKTNELIHEKSVLASIRITNQHRGFIRLSDQLNSNHRGTKEIKIIAASRRLDSSSVYIDYNVANGSHILETSKQEKFILHVESNQTVINNQVVAELISNTYVTQTGGIVKYLDLPVSKKKIGDGQDFYDILGSGYILWISEETHEINKDIALLLVSNGDFVEAGTEIVKNIFAKNSGIVEVLKQDGIILEVVIKPGDIYSIPVSAINNNKHRGFLRPGEQIVEGITTNKLVYWEYIHTAEKDYILIRPVIVYSIPNKEYQFCKDELNKKETLELSVINRTPFKDGDRVKSVNGVNLVKTYLLLQVENSNTLISCTAEFEPKYNDPNSYILQFIIAESLSLKAESLYKAGSISSVTNLLVKDGQLIEENTVIAQTDILSTSDGIIEYIDDMNIYNRRLLVITDLDQKVFEVPKEHLKVGINDWVCSGDEIGNNIISLESGKIISIHESKVTMRIGRPYLVSHGAILHVNNDNLVQRGENLATLIFERTKTGDIVQGLPRIEEILEARKKADTNFNPHVLLENSFNSYLGIGLNSYNATILSIHEIQLFLVKEVQLVYQSQGVDIADKHIEVIVRQMTSKVKIETGGDTDFLPGEIVELQKIHDVNNTMCILNKRESIYSPILLGITKASLNTESFISAASFQETTKVLTEAAISGKLDWLKGLKENVIIGRLIPAGTGFNVYNKNLDTHQSSADHSNTAINLKHYKKTNNTEDASIDDIILDDRSARKYPLSQN
uniref:DNA-directed RNA polymerase n=1 Tax=Palmaria palmata TaxID=2822 RepID=A0A1C9CH35_PALPL|nr:RNA polymerase beta'' subunit [Palmaria palmata]AOM67672.1 RNA polymerase beta'' subunit [Palmaria palmata]